MRKPTPEQMRETARLMGFASVEDALLGALKWNLALMRRLGGKVEVPIAELSDDQAFFRARHDYRRGVVTLEVLHVKGTS